MSYSPASAESEYSYRVTFTVLLQNAPWFELVNRFPQMTATPRRTCQETGASKVADILPTVSFTPFRFIAPDLTRMTAVGWSRDSAKRPFGSAFAFELIEFLKEKTI